MTTKQARQLQQTLSDTSTVEALTTYEQIYGWSYTSVSAALADAGWDEQIQKPPAKAADRCPGCGAPCPGERCPLRAIKAA